MRDMTEPTYTNRADMCCVMKAMCELLTRQSGGAFEYSYKLDIPGNEDGSASAKERYEPDALHA